MNPVLTAPISEVTAHPATVLAYTAIVEHGQIRAPAGSPVVPLHLKPGTPEWEASFEQLEATLREHPVTLDELSDDELNAIVHEVRAERHVAMLGH